MILEILYASCIKGAARTECARGSLPHAPPPLPEEYAAVKENTTSDGS